MSPEESTPPQPQKQPNDQSVQSESRKVGWLLGIGIVFVPFVFAWFTLREGHSTKAKVASFAWLGLVVISAIADPPEDSEEADSSTPAAVTSPSESQEADPEPQKPQRQFVDIDCNELVSKFGPSSDLSDLQKEEAWKKYTGKAVRYNLTVVEVSEATFGGFQVQAKCPGSDSLVQDMAVEYPDKYREFVIELKKGSTYELTGTLDTYTGMTGPILTGFVE